MQLSQRMTAGALALATAATGCSTPRMAPPGDVASASDVLTVSDRSRASGALVNEGFKLGPYTVEDVDRKWDRASGGGVGPWSKETKTSGYKYVLTTGSGKLTGKCASKSSAQAVGGFSWGTVEMACTCEGEAGRAEVAMAGDDRKLSIGETSYRLAPIFELENGKRSGKPSGFRADGDELLGAVEVGYPGQVWLKKGVDAGTGEQAACLFVGLMLYQPPDD